jgi:hypothetical protein
MQHSINGIKITSFSIKRCYEKFYKQSTFPLIDNKNYFHYLHLFGIRTSTADSSQPDDFLGGFRVTNINLYESIVGKASLEPSPTNLTRFFDAEARAKGGAAFVREGQHFYRYMGRNFRNWKPYPSFCPSQNTKVYRYLPEQPVIDAWKKTGKPPLSAGFQPELNKLKQGRPSRVKLSDSTDTCIHRSWGKTRFTNDSAGCQITPEYDVLNRLGTWAEEHIKKRYGNAFTYTVFTKEQFIEANTDYNPSFGNQSWLEIFTNLFRFRR